MIDAYNSGKDSGLDPIGVGTLVAMRKFSDVASGLGIPNRLMISTVQAISTIIDVISTKLQKPE